MNRVVHFEIGADDLGRAIAFYQNVFRWTIKKWEGVNADYWLIATGPKQEPGIDGGLVKREIPGAGDRFSAYLCTIAVDNIDEMSKKIADNGGLIVKPKYEIMGVGWLAYCKDTEGNLFNIMQSSMPPGATM